MLPKSQRLNLKTDFKWVVNGQKLETKNFKIFLRQGENDVPRIGIALSSQVFKKATLRSKAKRLTSRAVEQIYSSLKRNLNLVIMPKGSCLTSQPDQLVEELKYVKNLSFD
ncbi:ribonuclease P protein component [Candidatus Daviesbacteria bacterium]|nr:ribonuclease P protein component [Candidatus Daviesbacteria bacterium]